MTADFERTRRLFDGALRLPPEEREAFLRARCPEDEETVREVLALLASDEAAPDEFLTSSSEYRVPAELRRDDD